MSQIWAVARQTVSEGIRMKIALVFLVLIGAVVVGLPFSLDGEGSLPDAVQSFMSYGFTATGFFLGLLTIFMSRSLSDELVNRQLFLIVTKPVARWRFVFGKWLGIMLLNAAFLLSAAITIYAMVHYIKRTHPPINEEFERAQLKNEVLVARHAKPFKFPDFSQQVEAEFERNREQGLYDGIPDFDPRAEKARLEKKFEARWRIVGPMAGRVFEFDQVLVDRDRYPYIQLRYKADVSGYPPDEIFRAWWLFGNRAKGTVERRVPVRHMVGRYHTIRVPADVVAPDGSLTVRFFNENPYPGEPQFRNVIDFSTADPVEVLFVVGSFEGNFLRLLVLMFCKLMFLGAVAILMAGVFSFPVACLASLTVYVLAGAQKFLFDAIDFVTHDYAGLFSSVKEFAARIVLFVVQGVCYTLPDFAYYDGVESFVNGRNVGLVWVLDGVVNVGILRSGILLGLAMLLFQRREVAEVSV